MQLIQSSLFKRSIKKLKKQEKQALDKAIRAIRENPEIGEHKKGDLQSVQVYKFKINKLLYLLAYKVNDTAILLLSLGSHENFYKKLKNYTQ